jgi:hypothetical protein
MRRLLAVLVVSMVAGGTWAGPASAQGSGVYADDPDSPGGYEYDIPAERPRRQVAPEGTERRSGGDSEPLFGAGIEEEDGTGGTAGATADGQSEDSGSSAADEDGGAGSSGDGSGSGGGASGSGGSQAGSAEGGASDAGGAAPATTSASASSGASPELKLSALAAAVLLAGAGLGLLMGRLRRNP